MQLMYIVIMEDWRFIIPNYKRIYPLQQVQDFVLYLAMSATRGPEIIPGFTGLLFAPILCANWMPKCMVS